jgi:predicted ribonuclease toxin of YeeF-YezG toxin-antitoxin module
VKVLDVASLKEGIHATLQEIEKVQSQLSSVQRSVRDIIALDQYLKGQTGEAIRSFYKQIHEPFLIFIHQSLTDYAEKLQNIEQAIKSYEPDENGLIRQEFLDYHVKRGLDRTEDIANDLVSQANNEIATIADLVSLPRLDMNELSFFVQKGRQQTRQIVDQLHKLDHTQTKNLAEVTGKLDVMKQYTSEMTRSFNQGGQALNSFGFPSIFYLPTLPTIMKSVYGEQPVAAEEVKEDNFFVKGLKVTGNSIKGTGVGLFDVVKDTAVGLYDTVTDPIGTVETLYHSVTNPIETYKFIEKAIVDSYERDMINGDAESRSHWVAYALGTTATAVFGTKGAGAITKTGVATTKSAVQKSVTTAQNVVQSPSLAQLLPYGRHMQVATPGGLPFNVINGPVKRDQLISMAKVNETKGIDNLKTRLPRTNGKWVGEPGNGKWYSDKLEVKNITKGEGVEFINGRPHLTPWSKGSLKFKDGMLDGSRNDFNLVYEKIKQLKGFKSMNQARVWLREKGLTPHHKNSTEIELIPTDLHSNIPHIGSASDLRGEK